MSSGTFTARGWPCRYRVAGCATAATWSCSQGGWCHLLSPPQALVATGEFYAPRVWDCAQAFAAVSRHDYRLPMAIAQVLPALVDRSYLDAADLDCATRMSPNLQSTLSPKLQPSLSPKLGTAAVHRGMAAPRTPWG